MQAYATPQEADAFRGEFDEREYDVTCICQKLFCGHVILELGPDEVENENTCLGGFFKKKKRIPYGELSGVDKTKALFCFTNFVAGDLNGTDDKGNPVPFCPGFGCSEGLVDEIVTELKSRQTARGAAGNLLRIEKQTKDLIRVEKKLDALLEHFSIDPQDMKR